MSSLITPKSSSLPSLEFFLSSFLQGEGSGNPLQDACLENAMYRRAWQATVHGVIKSRYDWETITDSLMFFFFLK